jgi:DNA repair protein SbcC/Rad50
MKILKLRFKNLNSLIGEWIIDFTQPEYEANGIFVISGPTGAGKSTILDALTLALYGRTPRLNKVTQSTNEVMSRHTGECYSEVIFETNSGIFRCNWSQRRSRNKPDGNLQSPKHEFVDHNSNTILKNKLSDVSELVENKTGMDFDRFTRSVLLAQGGFSAFLKAGPNERSPILEQITGTEIYSKISMEVHNRTSEEKNKLNILEAETNNVQLLSAEEATLNFEVQF